MSLCSLLLRSARIRQTAISVRPLLRRRYASEATLSTGLKPSRFGQPTLRSHPHLIQPGETTPGVPAHEYERRRRELMDALPEGSLIVAFSAPVKYMSAGIFYKYRQASDFWYLTGFEEPGSVVVLQKRGSQKGYYMTIYSTGRDPVKEQWEGSFTGHADIETIFGADDARPIDEFADNLHKHIAEASQIYADLPPSASKRKQTGRGLLKFLQVGRGRTDIEDLVSKFAGKIQPLAPRVGALRCVKSKYEQAVMRAAADISGRAHAKTMRFVEPGMSEADLHAHFEYLCARAGSQRPAYVPVVASGENALIIHYTKNHHLVRDGELVLMDAGCEYNGYASDISRTFPVSGKFTAPQAELYAAVLTAQKQLVELCVESGGASMNDLHRRSVELLRKELTQIGFDLNARSGILERVLYPHYLTHAVGIDLHEPNTYDRYKPLKEGMVITIEPGIYVPKTDAFPSEFRGIGIRIEDEVLVGKDHSVVLSAEAPKEIVDIEGACQGALGFEAF